MKKILKSLKRTFYDDFDVSKIQTDTTPQVNEPIKDSGKKSETAASVSVISDLCQNDAESTKNEVKITTAEAEKEVQADKKQSYFSRRMTRNSNCRVFLGGFPDDVTEIEVKKVFEKYGKVVDVTIPLDKETNKRKRYGFLEFLNEDSAKACLDDRFVTVSGKRVEVKIAWARGAEAREKSCDVETKKIGDRENLPSSSKDVDSMTERSLGSSSTDGESNMGDGQVLYQKLFENYFKAKFFLEKMLGSETVDAVANEKFKKQQSDEKEWEKILKGLYVCNSEDSSEEKDTEDLSSDSEKSSVEEPEYYSLCDSVDPVRPYKTEATPLLIKNEEKIVCNLCEWAPLDNSTEGFLAHCRTSFHQQKLKERFEKKETPDYPQGKASTPAYVKNRPRKTNRRRKQKQKDELKESPLESEDRLRKSVVEEIMSCVEAKSDKYIKCKICNTTISQASHIRTLMANLSQHIQSKGHLAKITKCNKPSERPENAKGKDVMGNKAKVRFRCLLCNYFCNRTKTFLAHLTSQSHTFNEKQTPVKTPSPQSLCDNLTNCSHCGILLYGGLDIIKNHITKCNNHSKGLRN